MSILKWLSGLILVLVAAMVGGAFLLPASTHVERTVDITRSPAEVFSMLNSYRRFNEWSPWHDRDPKTAYSYEGPVEGVGASMRWSSEQANVGKGRQTIVESVPNEKIGVKLEFEGQGDARSTYTLTANSEGTRVVWAFDTEHGNNVVSRWFGLMLDRWVGGDYQKGLAKLKTVLESTGQ